MNTVEYPELDVNAFEDPETQAIATQLNYVGKQVAELHGMMTEIYAIFEQLKPLMGAMPKMPSGLVTPPSFPWGAGHAGR